MKYLLSMELAFITLLAKKIYFCHKMLILITILTRLLKIVEHSLII